MESQLIYRFCHEKMGLGIDADIHKADELYQEIRRIELYDAIPWKVFMIYKDKECADSLLKQLLQLM